MLCGIDFLLVGETYLEGVLVGTLGKFISIRRDRGKLSVNLLCRTNTVSSVLDSTVQCDDAFILCACLRFRGEFSEFCNGMGVAYVTYYK